LFRIFLKNFLKKFLFEEGTGIHLTNVLLIT